MLEVVPKAKSSRVSFCMSTEGLGRRIWSLRLVAGFVRKAIPVCVLYRCLHRLCGSTDAEDILRFGVVDIVTFLDLLDHLGFSSSLTMQRIRLFHQCCFYPGKAFRLREQVAPSRDRSFDDASLA